MTFGFMMNSHLNIEDTGNSNLPQVNNYRKRSAQEKDMSFLLIPESPNSNIPKKFNSATKNTDSYQHSYDISH